MSYHKLPESHFPLSSIKIVDLAILKEKLHRFGYTQNSFHRLYINPYTRSPWEYPLLKSMFSKNKPFDILFSLFFLRSDVQKRYIETIFTAKEIQKMIKFNIFEEINIQNIRSKVMITPYDHFYFASDFYPRFFPENHLQFKLNNFVNEVFPPGKAALELWKAAVKKSVNSTLDLCSGCGVLATLISRFSNKVVGIDVNPRAINFAKFNLLLNNIKNVQFICGNLYNPVKSQKFDLILANPPYQIVYGKSELYAYGGKFGFEILAQIINSLPTFLEEYGFCQIITEIAEWPDISKKRLIQKWLRNKDFKILFLEKNNINIFQYAYSSCINKFANFKQYLEKVENLLTYMKKMKIKYVSYGILNFKKSNRYTFKVKKYFTSMEIPNITSNIIKRHYEGS